MAQESVPTPPMSEEEKEKIEEDKQKLYKKDFSKWVYNELLQGKAATISYLPFVPALASSFYGYFKDDVIFGKVHFTHQQIFNWSILVQVFIIFCILIYQVYIFSVTDKNGLKGRVKKLIDHWNDISPTVQLVSEEDQVIYQFTHTNIIEEEEKESKHPKKTERNHAERNTLYWKKFKDDFDAANKNILYFKISWIILWMNWFCFYIALLVQSQSSALFDFFMITETLCFAACYYRLTHHVFESKNKEMNQYWWAVIIAALLFALGIADQSTQDLFVPQMITSVFKTLFSCVFLGLLIGTLTVHVKTSPNWLKILLFCYVALQPMLFGIFEMPSMTKNYFAKTVREAEADLPEKDRITSRTLSNLIANENITYIANFKDTVKKSRGVDSIIIIKETFKVDSVKKLKGASESFTVSGTIKVDTMKQAVAVKQAPSKKDSTLRPQLGNATQVINDSVALTDTLGVIMLNLCLALKYLLMFYFIWLLKYDHLMVYFMRTQGDQVYVQKFREIFEDKIRDLTEPKPDTKDSPKTP